MSKTIMVVLALLALAACGQPGLHTSQTSATSATTTTRAPKAEGADAPSTAWDRNLLALLPQIDACIAKQPDARQITYAGARDGGVFVRLSGPQNNFDCRVERGAAQVSTRNDALTIDGENAAIFVRGPGANPGGECYQAPEVHDANGELVGWMIDPEGC